MYGTIVVCGVTFHRLKQEEELNKIKKTEFAIYQITSCDQK